LASRVLNAIGLNDLDDLPYGKVFFRYMRSSSYGSEGGKGRIGCLKTAGLSENERVCLKTGGAPKERITGTVKGLETGGGN
jgi:hypothetical protein